MQWEAVHNIKSSHYKVHKTWLGEHLDKRFDEIIELDMSYNHEYFKNNIHAIRNLPFLQIINVTLSDFDDKSMESIRYCYNLKELYASDTQITNAGISNLENLKHLKIVYLDNTLISNDCLKYIISSRNILNLSFRGTKINDSSLKYIKYFKNLESLDLSISSVNDITDLRNCANLTSLKLSNTSVSDEYMTELSNLHSIKRLNINHTKITDIS